MGATATTGWGLAPLADTLRWPFFEDRHRDFAARLAAWADATLPGLPHDTATNEGLDAACRARVEALGAAGFLDAAAPADGKLEVRTLCLAREILAFRDGLADFAFAMQGLGTGPVTLFGERARWAEHLAAVRGGRSVAAFALSEPEAGSDVAALAMTATPASDGYRLDGEKTWISNGGLADAYVVFARTGEAAGARGLSAFVVPADAPGLTVMERIDVVAPHPLARLRFEAVRVPASARLGSGGDGFRIAMGTLDVFRSTVGAAALGFARRALHESVERAATRNLFGAPLGDLQLTQAALADSATDIDASALLIYRAAAAKDAGAPRVTREAAMAKMFATEAAQRAVDRAVQLFGGLGVTRGVKVEELYREVRALRIYEGATEVQKVVIARDLLKSRAGAAETQKPGRAA